MLSGNSQCVKEYSRADIYRRKEEEEDEVGFETRL
jgi:hypothetical protein